MVLTWFDARNIYSKMDVTSVIDACQSNMLEKSIHRKIDATCLKNYIRLFTFVIKMIENMIIGVKYVVIRF